MPGQPPSDIDPTNASVARGATLVLASADLFGGRAEIRIAHEGVTYRLRKTANGKLILTK